MTATPIPRTLALTIYGDLDLSILDELPAGRKSPITKIISPEERGTAYAMIKEEINKGRQAYIICPRIEEPDPKKKWLCSPSPSKKRRKKLKKKFFRMGNRNSARQDDAAKKEEVLSDFKDNKIQILVATSVVEVGINIPNATIIIIEGAERFGLAQLHQLRGRVIRSSFQPYCLVFAESKSQKTTERLKALTTAKNGFELAEYDLKIRGAGELGGGKQWGVSDIGMEALKNIKMVEAARAESQKIIGESPDLGKHPLMLEKISNNGKQIHFE